MHLHKIIDKIKNKNDLSNLKNQLLLSNKKLVFTNGCFDILHRGHIEYLAKSADLGDFLLVGVNSDASVKRLNKSPERPINDEYTRCINLAALQFIGAVVIFDEDNPLNLIKTIVPDFLVKGGDYDANETDQSSKKYIIGSDIVKNSGGIVKTISLVEGYSTTHIIEKIRKK